MLKEEPKPEIARTDISANINMNLNQNDVIEVAIQEYLQVLQPKIIEAEKAFKSAVETMHTKIVEFTQEMCKGVSGSKIVEDFFGICNRYKMTPRFTVLNRRTDTGTKVFTYPYCDIGRAEDYKEPLSYFRRTTRTENMYVNPPESVAGMQANSKDQSEGPEVNFYINQLNIKIGRGKADAYVNKVSPFYKAVADAGKALYDLQVEYLEYKYNEKKIKAKVVKESLSRSKEGRAILGLLQDATKVKLLS